MKLLTRSPKSGGSRCGVGRVAGLHRTMRLPALYKQELGKHLPPEVSDLVMWVNSGEIKYSARQPVKAAGGNTNLVRLSVASLLTGEPWPRGWAFPFC